MKLRTRILTTVGVVGALAAAGTAYSVASDDGASSDDIKRAGDAALAETGGSSIREVEADDQGFDVEVVLPDGKRIDVDLDRDFRVLTTDPDGPDDDDHDVGDDVLTDDLAYQRAADAALAAAGDGTVIEVDRDGTGYDVEIVTADGKQIDVELDADFNVVRQELED